MKTVEQIRAEYAEKAEKEISALMSDQLVLAQLPIVPHKIGVPNKALGRWVHYKAGTFKQVSEIVRAFGPMIIETLRVKNGCLYCRPFELLEKSQQEKTPEGTHVFCLDIQQGRGFGPCVDFSFYTRLPSGEIVRIKIDLPNNHLASARMTSPTYNRLGVSLGDGKALPNGVLYGLFHGITQWASNVRGEDAHYAYYLNDDGPDYAETLEILENSTITEWYKGE